MLDEVPSSLSASPVIASVRFERLPESTLHVLVPSYGRRGPIEDGVGAHLRGHQFLDDVIPAHGRERERSGPEEETRPHDDFFAGSEDELLRLSRIPG